nr:hypothetical protein [Escherichia coli]
MNIELLQQLCEASAVSGDEQEVRDILINTLEPCVNEITFDGLGSFVARKGNKGPKVAVVGHMDEVGFMVTHIDESGFLRFTTIGGWWNQSMLNHRVTIRTHKGVKITVKFLINHKFKSIFHHIVYLIYTMLSVSYRAKQAGLAKQFLANLLFNVAFNDH